MHTTFVIGAGASKDLNGAFTVGSELAEKIESLLNEELRPGSYGPIAEAIMRTPSGLSTPHVEAMGRIRASILSEDSIDDFLSAWNEVPFLDEVAKLAIAYVILQAERNSTLFVEAVTEAERTSRLRQFNHSWLGRIIRRPDKPRRDLEATLEGISFVTFNYDRLIEQYIKIYARYVLDRSEEEADLIINNIGIAHAYGSLGSITSRMPVQFGANDQFVPMAAKQIRTYKEDHPDDEVRRIRDIIEKSDKIIFLGCAYHPQNLDLLFGEDETVSHSDKLFLGTCMGVPPRKLAAARNRLAKFGTSNLNPHLACSAYVIDADDGIFY